MSEKKVKNARPISSIVKAVSALKPGGRITTTRAIATGVKTFVGPLLGFDITTKTNDDGACVISRVE